jgi:cation transport regulator
MPYEKINELPEGVKDNLPKHAQEIYMSAFNSAWDQYDEPEERRGDDSREETAHKVAWAAVKKKYEKQGDRWVAKKE